MPFGAYNGKPAPFAHISFELDVRTAASHIGGDGNASWFASLCHDVCFLLVKLCVEYVMRYALHLEHLAQQFGGLHTGGAHQHGAPFGYEPFYLIDNRLKLFALGLIDHIVHILAGYGLIGGDFHHIELIDIPEFARFGRGRPRHTCQLLIHAEVVLESDGGIGLSGSFHLRVLFRFHCLVQSIAPTATFHDAPRLLVDDLHLVVLCENIVYIAHEESIGF